MVGQCVVPRAVIHLSSEDADTKLAAVWCIINLSWPRLSGQSSPAAMSMHATEMPRSAVYSVCECVLVDWLVGEGSQQRVDRLRALGCDTILEKMSTESETGTQVRSSAACQCCLTVLLNSAA